MCSSDLAVGSKMIYLGCNKVYILCGSEGCDLRAVKWSPDVVLRSAKWCGMEVQYGVIRQSVSRVRDRVKVRDGAKQNNETR